MKESLKKFWHGILFGFGLAIAFWIITNFAAVEVAKNFSASMKELNQPPITERAKVNIETPKAPIEVNNIPTLLPADEDTKLVFLSNSVVSGGLGLEIIGTLKNNSSNVYRSAELEAELFDKEGKFIYECKEYIHEPIGAGNSINFKISCRPLGKEITEAYASYKMKVTHVGLIRN